jgi:ATP-dependent DNA ligase
MHSLSLVPARRGDFVWSTAMKDVRTSRNKLQEIELMLPALDHREPMMPAVKKARRGKVATSLPIHPPFAPMEATLVDKVPVGAEWQYEPKWDGFRCLLFRDGDHIELQSKAERSLSRYFPEIAAAAHKLKAAHFVLDGELVVLIGQNASFDDLLQRIHPAASRVALFVGQAAALASRQITAPMHNGPLDETLLFVVVCL